MARKKVTAGKDFIQKIGITDPISALAELIWNSFDAGANTVEVVLRSNGTGAVQDIEIIDDGEGIAYEELAQAFGNLGNSKKLTNKETVNGRLVHGKEGKGRFKTFSLCNKPIWVTVFKNDNEYYKHIISIDNVFSDEYDDSDPEVSPLKKTGTTVILKDILQGQNSLARDDAKIKVAKHFVLYLLNYPGLSLVFDSRKIVIDDFIKTKKTYNLPTGNNDKLTVIEWNERLESKQLHLCNEHGFCRHEIAAGVHAPGIEYSAYLQSTMIEDVYNSGNLGLGDMSLDLIKLIDVAKDTIRDHIRKRLAEEAGDIVKEWKEQNIYPYSDDEPTGPIKEAEREVFDIVAITINEQHPTFKRNDLSNKKLTLALVKQALETNPSGISKILQELLSLPKEEQDGLVELLQRTTLSSIIKASSVVADRLDAIGAFEHIIFNSNWKKTLLERTQLHRLLVHHLWIFGEGYTLDSDDESLTAILEKHIKKLGRKKIIEDVNVKTVSGINGIPDLLLSKQFTHSHELFENLVIELKRPSIKLGNTELTQIEDYAITVSEDERFDTDRYKWKFILVGNNYDRFVKAKINQPRFPKYCSMDSGNVQVYVRTWADIFADAKLRYKFFSEKLEIEAKTESGMANFQEKYGHLITGNGMSKKKEKEAGKAPK